MNDEISIIKEEMYNSSHMDVIIKRSGLYGVRGTSQFDSRDEETAMRRYYKYLQDNNLIK